METVTLKMEPKPIALLKERAKLLGCSQGADLGDLIEDYLTPKKRSSLHVFAREPGGSLCSPKDLSARSLAGYGRD